jgi:hypothetical protein
MYLNANPYEGQGRVYYIPATDGNAYAIGDPVKTLSGGADANGTPAVTLAIAGDGNAIRGVIMGMGGTVEGATYGDPSNLNITVIPAAKNYGYYVMVSDDSDLLFLVQEFSGTGSTNFTAADIGKNCNLKAGTNNGFISGWTLDDTAVSSTAATRQVKLMCIQRTPDNAFGSYCKFIVRINNHELAGGTAGV